MKLRTTSRLVAFLASGAFAVAVAFSPLAQAQQTWQANVGGETPDMGTQGLGFFPNELWIHAGDSVQWTWQSSEIHTLTFLTVGQPFQHFQAGCPGFATSPASVDGSACVTTPPQVTGQTFTVAFPAPGSFKFQCLVHPHMTGTIHVLSAGDPLPYSQAFYNQEAARQLHSLITDSDRGMGNMQMSNDGDHDGDDVSVFTRNRPVIAGKGEVTATPGGLTDRAVLRFLKGTIHIRVGDTVEWTNHDPDEPHTITFGFNNGDPADTFDPTSNVTIDHDGALHAVISSTSDQVSSGFIEQPLLDEPGIPQNPIVNPFALGTTIGNVALFNPTRFRVTFMAPGTYNYHCVLHDNLGMVGKVVVEP
ncbi:MAG: cupredoxin domain-containing protein [Terriglobales bacterium]